ncbi:MAG: trehalose-phosphatase, partial [Actinomycetota bacterium]|nr:trehalose-phosphatase [Actinomycetota bacterium]
PGAIEALTALSGRGARIAVVTGRDVATVLRLGGLDSVPGLVVAGLYGLETWRDGELSSPETPPVIEALRERLPVTVAGADPAIWIEDKRLSLVVHARRAADPESALAAVRPGVSALADELGFELHPGSGVLELRLPGSDKGAAIARLVKEFAPSAVLYLGDDLGDLPAFELMRQLRGAGTPAWGVAVTSSGVPEVAAAGDVVLPDAAAAVLLLAALAD